MHVVATAGHVDHGKSTLVKALTGTDPDRYAEEKRRGLTIDLGFAWTDLDGETVAFVDVPGHERFVPTMLAGVGPVPAVLIVVAADGGWMPQSQEHLDALDALGVRRGLLVVTRCDLADPGPSLHVARERLAGTGLSGIDAVTVSAVSGLGMARLRAAIVALARSLPAADHTAPVRLWVDRSFTIRGAGTVVTGTLPAGTVRAGDRLRLRSGHDAVVRGVQSLGRNVPEASAVARVAVNLRGVSRDAVRRGDALTTPGSHLETAQVDVRLSRPDELPVECLLHIGSAQVAVHVRPLGERHARLTLRNSLPLRIGDVGLLRDPGRRHVLSGVTMLDVDPPSSLHRRGAARERAAVLRDMTGTPHLEGELSRRRVVRRARLAAMGVDVPAAGEWLVDDAHAGRLRHGLEALVTGHAHLRPLESGVAVEAARQLLGLPDATLLTALVAPPLAVESGRVVDTRRGTEQLPARVERAVAQIRAGMRDHPYAAPDAHRLEDAGLGQQELAAAVRARLLTRVAEGIYLTPEAVDAAPAALRALAQPFTLSQARQAWGTSRRVAVPLLEHLDRAGVTRRLPDDRRILAG